MPKRARARTQTMAAELTLAELCKAFDVRSPKFSDEDLEGRAPRRHAAQYACYLYTRNGRRYRNRRPLSQPQRGLGQRGGREQREQKERISHFRFSFSCNSRHRIFPVAVLGSSATNSTTRGTLNAAMRARAHSMMSSARSRSSAPGLGTITAFTVSPR